MDFLLILWAGIKRVPLKVWLIGALVAVVAGYHWHAVSAAYDEGEAKANKECAERQEKADAKALRESVMRQLLLDQRSDAIAADALKREHESKVKADRLKGELDHAKAVHPLPADCRLDPERVRILNDALGY